ncbi:MAG: serine hydrolase [Terrimicrobiaceae bacterium]|nr:serine hydrolase [Terrimicrobiaceae bacterium]
MHVFTKALTAMVLAGAVCTASAAESFIIVDNQTGYILGSEKPNEKLPVASLTKVATAMVVLDWARVSEGNLGSLATVSPTAVERAGGVNPVGLQPGDQASLRDLIYCALLASDNVAAMALAEYVGTRLPNPEQLDPAGNFVSHMNALARSLFMKRTLFLNPTGFDAYEEGAIPHSTAADMARLVRYAYDAGGFAFYVSQASREVRILRGGIDNTVTIRNTNELLGRDGIDGVKTGRTRRAGDCLILSADRTPEVRKEGETRFVTPRRITVVLLRSPDRFGEGAALMQRGWQLYDAWAAEGRPVSRSKAL